MASPLPSTANPPVLLSVIGSLMQDQIFTTTRAPGRGESVLASALNTAPAGKGANMAIAAYRASRVRPQAASGAVSKSASHSAAVASPEIKVFMNGAVGNDGIGPELRAGLEAQGLDVRGVEDRDGERTGVSVVMLEKGESGSGVDSRGLGFKGANASFDPSSEGIRGYAGGGLPDLVVMHLTMKRETAEAILGMAGREGVEVVVCASPAVGLSREVYKDVTHLVMNEHEAAVLAGVGSVADPGVGEDGLAKVAEGFVRWGARNVVITLGEAGAYYATHTGESGRAPAEKGVKVVDTTGAGDTFVGAYAVDYIRQKRRGEWDIRQAVVFASRAAARAVEQMGAQTGMPWMNEI